MIISIAMATYNGAKYVSEQLNSILSQTINDFELVVCDDCSSDDTWRILQDYVKIDCRIKAHRNKNTLGFKENFEKAIGLCHGDYIALCDQDDIWLPNHLETLLSIIGDKMIACGNAEMIDKNGKLVGMTLQEMESFDYVPNNNEELASSIIFFRNPFQGASMLIKREFLTYALPIPEQISYHDSWFANLCFFCGGISYTTQIVNQYRMHGDNVTGNRLKRRSRIKTFLSLVLFAKTSDERLNTVKCVKNRIRVSKENEVEFLTNVLIILNRSSSFYGRFLNCIFFLKNYRTIFNINSFHFI